MFFFKIIIDFLIKFLLKLTSGLLILKHGIKKCSVHLERLKDTSTKNAKKCSQPMNAKNHRCANSTRSKENQMAVTPATKSVRSLLKMLPQRAPIKIPPLVKY